jgi:hypothetical protein
MSEYIEPKRIKYFRLEVVNAIPRIPNNLESLRELEGMSLAHVLVHYSNWASRRVKPRPRAVTVEPEVTKDPRWSRLGSDIKLFLEKVRKGEDLTPHLSLTALKRGYVAKGGTASSDKWADKDFLLNVMGYHHFHLSSASEAAGHNHRTNDVLFAQVFKDSFVAVGIFDHSVFESLDDTPAMTAERDRLWAVYQARKTRGAKPGAVYIESLISSSGHSYWHTQLASQYARRIHELDPQLDDPSFLARCFAVDDAKELGRLKPRWALNYLDLHLFEERTGRWRLLQEGPL